MCVLAGTNEIRGAMNVWLGDATCSDEGNLFFMRRRRSTGTSPVPEESPSGDERLHDLRG